MGIYSVLDTNFFEPKRKIEEKERLINEKNQLTKLWSKPTIKFFQNFNCTNLLYQEKEIKINKFLVVESYRNEKCNLSLESDLEIEKLEYFEKYYTRNIDSANVIIWIVDEPGNEEGNYTNFTKAIRLRTIINYIEKSTNTIYKKEIINYSGSAPKKIERLQGGRHPEYFGSKQYEKIYISIGKEIERKNS